jgi:hypothetical protein
MKASNYGVLVVNGEDYNMDDESAAIMAIQVFNQFKLVDPDFHQWSMKNKWEARKVYVRLPIKNYPIYNIDIPPALIQKNNHVNNYFGI